MVVTVENLKTRLADMINEREDLSAMHNSDANVKEHLIERVHELEKVNMEKGTELLFIRRTMQSIADEKDSLERKAESAVRDLSEVSGLAKKKIKVLKDHSNKLTEENRVLLQAMDGLRAYFINSNANY